MKLALSLALFRFLSTLQATVLIVAGSRVVATVWGRRRPPGPSEVKRATQSRRTGRSQRTSEGAQAKVGPQNGRTGARSAEQQSLWAPDRPS